MNIALHRIMRRIETWDSDYGGRDEIAHVETDRTRADVVTSQLAEDPKLHAPLLDLDLPHLLPLQHAGSRAPVSRQAGDLAGVQARAPCDVEVRA